LTYAYKLVRTWKVTDACGNNGTVSQTMLVRGIQLTCPSDKTVNTNSDGVNNYNCGTILNAALGLTPVYLDNCAVSTLKYELSGATSSFGSGSVAGIAFQKGITQVKYKLAHSGTDNCTFKVIVNDNELPRVTLNSTNTTVVLDNCSFDNVQFDTYKPIVSDNCTAMPTLSVLSDVSADISGCATKTADLKYTKKITRTWKATDDNGNTATALQTFYLRDKIAPTAECSTPIVSIGNTNLTYAASGLNNGSSDNCTSSSMLTFRACVGAGCTNYATNLTLRKTQISSPLTQTDLVVNVQVSDACGNTSVKTTKITLKKAGTLGNTKQSDTFNNEVSDNETNSPAEASAIPTVQGEMKCFPNPFNEDLNIQYNLTKPHENVTLKVYDNQGRLLKTMEQAEQLAGFYQIRWSLSDLKAGMYHICLELDGKCTKMERVILMK
jgi:flagellar hook assembly protein FlgD